MLHRRILKIKMMVAILILAPFLIATTANRGSKSGGGTAWQDGNALTAAELNADFDNIYTHVNGQLDDDNVTDGSLTIGSMNLTGAITNTHISSGGSDRIAAEKIDDESLTNGEAQTTTTPGTTGSQTLATDLRGELQMLRYAIQRLAHGNDSTLFWFDPPTVVSSGNLLRNGSFEMHNNGATSVPDGWVIQVSPGITYSQTQLTEGSGDEINVTNNGGHINEGITQTLAGLKPSTTYSIRGRALADSGDTCTIRTTGAGTQAALTTASDTAYETLSGTFITNSTPSDVVVILEADATEDVCAFDHIIVSEQKTDAISAPSSAIAYTSSTGTTPLTGSYQGLLELDVTIPDDGYYIKIIAKSCGDNDTGTDGLFRVAIREDINGAESFSVVDTAEVRSNHFEEHSLTLFYVKVNPVPGVTYTYEVAALEAIAQFTAGGGNCTDEASLMVELVRAY